jgi:hypothetical protein
LTQVEYLDLTRIMVDPKQCVRIGTRGLRALSREEIGQSAGRRETRLLLHVEVELDPVDPERGIEA